MLIPAAIVVFFLVLAACEDGNAASKQAFYQAQLDAYEAELDRKIDTAPRYRLESNPARVVWEVYRNGKHVEVSSEEWHRLYGVRS
jgi:hypothetical protein